MIRLVHDYTRTLQRLYNKQAFKHSVLYVHLQKLQAYPDVGLSIQAYDPRL